MYIDFHIPGGNLNLRWEEGRKFERGKRKERERKEEEKICRNKLAIEEKGKQWLKQAAKKEERKKRWVEYNWEIKWNTRRKDWRRRKK